MDGPGRLLRGLRRCRAERSGVAALEFALCLPLLLAFTSGIYEYASFIRQSRQLSDTANSLAEVLSMNSDSDVNYSDLHYVYDSAMLTFPKVLADSATKGITWSNDITISMAGISFAPTVTGCTSSCTYRANVVWTGGAKQRVCGTHPASAVDTAQPSATTLPSNLFTPVANPQGGSLPPLFIIVADVTYTWSPSIFTRVIAPVVMKRSAYINPRYTSAITYTTASGDDGFGNACP